MTGIRLDRKRLRSKTAETLRLFPNRSDLVPAWLHFVYGHGDAPQPALAARILEARADLIGDDPHLACVAGDVSTIERAVAAGPAWIRAVSPWRCPCGAACDMTPLVAVTHSSLIRGGLQARLRDAARVLLGAGADPNQVWHFNPQMPLSALYGAAGLNHDPDMTRLLLAAGAHPDDGESLYHAFEGEDLTCARLLLEAGATTAGTNAIYRNLDTDRLDGLTLLLSHGADPNELSGALDAPLHHAIRRRRSAAHIKALLDAGADPRAVGQNAVTPFVLAHRYGLPEAVSLLTAAGAAESLSVEEQFVAACARGDRDAAAQHHDRRPDLPGALTREQLQQLPNLAAIGGTGDAIQLMVDMGWPIDVAGGIGFVASALHHAVARGDAVLTHLLLENGAKFSELNSYKDDVGGTLAWASRQDLGDEADVVGCAEALLAHGMRVGEEYLRTAAERSDSHRQSSPRS